MRAPGAETLTLAVVAMVVAGLCGLPLLLLFRIGLAPEGVPTLEPLAAALDSASVLRAMRRSVESSLAAAAIATGVGTALALAIGLADLRRKAALVFCLLLPMMIPPHVIAIAWTQALGPASPVLQALGIAPPPGTPNPVQTPGGMIALLALTTAPLVFLVVRAALRSFPRELTDAARTSGAGPGRVMGRIVLPLLAPALLAGFALAFVAALGNFGITALIGIPARYTTLPVLIWRRLASFGPQVLEDVAVISVLLAALALAAVAVQTALARRMRSALVGLPQAPLAFRLGPWRGAVEGALWLFVAGTLALPLAALVATALVPTYGVPLTVETATLRNLAEVAAGQSVTARAFVNSTLAAGLAALAIAALAIPLGHRLAGRAGPGRRVAGGAAGLAEVAFAVPGLVMSIAFILAFIRPLPGLDLTLYGTLAIIGLAYVACFLAVGLKPVAAACLQTDPALDEAARVAGASYGRRMLRIVAPPLAPAAASGAILVFLTAYNEVTVSALLWSTGNETIGTVIFNYEDGGYTTLAAAMAALTVAATAAIMAAASLLAGRVPEGTIPWRD